MKGWPLLLARRLVHFAFTVWLTVTMLFIALVMIKGDPISLYLDPRLDQEARERIKATYGYGESPIIQYFNYLSSLAKGDMGLSFIHKKPVMDVIGPRIRSSLILGTSAIFLGIGLAFVLLACNVQSKWPWLSKVGILLTTISYSIPTFVIATILLAIFAVKLGWLPMFGSRTLFVTEPTFMDHFKSAILPVFSMAIHIGGSFALYLSERITQLEKATFVQSARGRGVSEWRIFWNHKLRAVFPQFIQLLGLYLPSVAAGALVVEVIFGWAGMGTLLFDATFSRDYPLLLAGTLWAACLMIPGYELADLIRERFESQGVVQ